MRNSRLGRKILIYMLIASVGMGAAVFALAMYAMNRMYIRSASAAEEMAEKSREFSSSELLGQAEDTLQQATEGGAARRSITFSHVSMEMRSLSGVLTRMYSEPEDYPGSTPLRPEETPDGILMARGCIVSGVRATTEILREQRRITCLEAQISSDFENDPLYSCIMVGTRTGIFYRYSDSNSYDTSYDPRERDWYRNAIASPGEVVWSEAYTDLYGKEVVTCSKAYFDEDRNIAGVVAADISIASMVENILNQTEKGGVAFIIDSHGHYVAKPEEMLDSFLTEGERKSVLTDMLSGESGVRTVEVAGKKEYLAFSPIEETGWVFGISVPYESVTAVSDANSAVIDDMAADNSSFLRNFQLSQQRWFLLVFVICLMVIGILAYALTETIRRPVERLTEGVRIMGNGDLDSRIEVKGNDEIAELGSAFNNLSGELKQYIADLSAALEEKSRTDTELSLAKQIQEGMLPSVFPAFPERRDFDICAVMDPAREVGGDFYDFFMPDERHLVMVIADVSGKGMPAALFMVVARTLIKNEAMSETSPALILQNVNEQLTENNSADMFVTAWIGIADLTTGNVLCANAGHEYPFLRTGDRFELYRDRHGIVLGGMSGVRYREYEISVPEGGTLFVYTDGLAEAQNAAQEMFGTKRALESLNRSAGDAPEELLHRLRADVDAFVGDAAQFDDMTMLCWKRTSPEVADNGTDAEIQRAGGEKDEV